MANKKATTKSTSGRTAATKTTAKKTTAKAKAPAAKSAAKVTAAPAPVRATTSTVVSARPFPENLASIILAEIIGTFILTLVALTTASLGVWYVGIALVVLVLAIGAISGSHINPAVTFGLWVARRVKGSMVPVYMLAQLVGGLFAVGVMSVMTVGHFAVNLLGNFTQLNWALLGVELVGTAIFLFGLVAVVSRTTLNNTAKAVGIGLSLTIGLVASGSLLTAVQNSAYQNYQKTAASAESTTQPKLPRELMIKGAVLNPAVAVAVSESTEAQLTGGGGSEEEKAPVSRFGLEVILGSLAGGALGAGLFMLMNYRVRETV